MIKMNGMSSAKRGNLSQTEEFQKDNDCVFCDTDHLNILSCNQLSFAVFDLFPVTEFHVLVIPNRHTSNFFDLRQTEIQAMHALLKVMKKQIESKDPKVTGFNVGVNVGEDAGQSVFHSHIHLIPRRYGDSNMVWNNPLGGIRWSVPKL